jgi:hypothetical protein
MRARGLDLLVALAIAAAALAWDASFHVVPAEGGAWRGISDPPGALRVAFSLLLAIGGALALSRLAPAVRRPFVVLLAAALPLVPVLTGRLVALLLFQGPVLRLLAGAVICVAVVRLWAASGPGPGRAPLPLLFAAAFAFYAAWGERVPGSGPQGDEPHYLVIAQSLLSDGDVDLTDEHARREYAPFYGGDLAPHVSPNAPPGRLYSMHSPGLPALLLPAYATGGYRGARLLASALAALAAALLYRLVLAVTKSDGTAAAAWALAAFTPPLPFYAVTLYPETLAALAIVAFLLAARGVPGAWAVAAVTLLAGVLPWVHTKYIPLAAAGLGFTLLRPMRWATRAAALAAFGAALFALAVFFHTHYGSASFTTALGPADVAPRRIPYGLAGALLDRQYGMLTVAPALVLAVPGLVALWRWRTGDALRAAVLALIVALPAAAYVGWWGGAAPPARYVLPLVGPALLAAAAVLPRARDLAAALFGIGLAVLGLAADAPRMLRNRPDGESLLLRGLSPGVDVNAWLPSFVEGGTAALVLAASLAALFAMAWRWGGRGLLAGLAAYALSVAGVGDRPLVDRGPATQRLLHDWSEANGIRTSPASWRDLAVPFELPRGPWTLDRGEARNSRRLLLPPGAYRVEARVRATEAPAAVRIDAFAGDLPLGSLPAADTGVFTMPLVLPAGGRGIAVSATGISGRALVEDVRVVPEALVPREQRGAFPWPERPDADRYRVETGGLRVTVLDRTPREGEGFRVRGEGAFLVEAPPGGVVRMTVRRAGADADAVTDLDAAGAVDLGRVSVRPVRVPAEDAWVGFALGGR